MKTEKRFNQVCILDVCYSDYFSGYHMPHLTVSLWYGMSKKDLKDAIESEINQAYDYFVNEDNPEQTYTDEEMKMFKQWANNLLKEKGTVNKWFELEKDMFTEEEGVCLFLGLCKPVTMYGLTFLNE